MSLVKPSTFRAVGLPPAFFREAYVVVSVWQPATTIWMAEYHILTKRPHEHLDWCVIDFDTTTYPAVLGIIDAAFMEDEALRQAQLDLVLELENLATASNRPELAYLPIALQRANITPVTLWVRNVFPVKFHDMMTVTKSPDLKNYLTVVMSMKKLRTP